MHPRHTPPEYPGDRPEPATSGYVGHTATTSVPVSRTAFLAWANGRELGDLVEPGKGMSRVIATTPLRGHWDAGRNRTGNRRRVEFADGTYLAEEVLADTPDRFRYMIWGFTGPQRFAVRYAVAEFTYTERDGGTDVRWTYSFRPTSPLTRPLVAAFVRRTMVSMMGATLEGMRSGARRDVVR